MYGNCESQVSAIPFGGANLGAAGTAGLTCLAWWQQAVWVGVLLFAGIALGTICTVAWYKLRRRRTEGGEDL